MPIRDSHAAGTPSWVDLIAPDVEVAVEFYAAVLGWEYERDPTGEIDYIMATVEGRPAAGVMELSAEMREQGVPPCWNVYVTVDDAEAAAAAIAAAGGTVMQPPMNVPDNIPEPAGRLVVGADPTGAVFCTWKPLAGIGAGIVNAPGAFTWAAVSTHDDDAAAAFYGELFGWEAGAMEGMDPSPIVFMLDGSPVASTSMAPPPGVPPHWRVTFGSADVDAACAEAASRGGQVIAPPFDWQLGRSAAVADPAGAVFELITLTNWPD